MSQQARKRTLEIGNQDMLVIQGHLVRVEAFNYPVPKSYITGIRLLSVVPVTRGLDWRSR